MRSVRIFLGTMLVGVVALVVGAGPVSAGNGTPTYYGHFDGAITHGTCTVGDISGDATGSWSVRLNGTKTAHGSFTIYVDREFHVGYSVPMKQEPTSGDEVLKAAFRSGAGPLTVTVVGDEMTYRIEPYDYTPFDPENGAKCDWVEYHGVLDSVS